MRSFASACCFYDGCPNLEAFLDPETFIRVPMDAPDEAIEIIRRAIAANEWERRLPAIREQKRKTHGGSESARGDPQGGEW